MVKARYVPEAGHLIKLNFDPSAGHEQAGWRPAIVLSPASYNRASGLMIAAPVTSHVKGYPFEVPLPQGGRVHGVILADAFRNVDWRARDARFVTMAPPGVLAKVRYLAGTLMGLKTS